MADTSTEMGDSSSDMSQGYCVELHVLADGTYRVSGPESLQHEADEGEDPAEGTPFKSLGEALKGLMQVVSENPVDAAEASADQDMQAGYAAR